MEYSFYIRASRGQSNPKSLAKAAHDKAAEFFGDEKFEVEAGVLGKPDDFQLQCVARANVEVV